MLQGIDRTYAPVVDVDISVANHPCWTGKGRILDTEGRVEDFRRHHGVSS